MAVIRQSVLATLLIVGVSFQAFAEDEYVAASDHPWVFGAVSSVSRVTTQHPLKLGESALGLLSRVDTPSFSVPLEESDTVWVSTPLKYNFMRPLGEMQGSAGLHSPHYTFIE
ncbi:MAG: hypothetical protein KDI27_01130 [Gammaproteobacteria bacterium]|nr:hypothetical protein [Gammaproteobacteria bacterium]MCB1849616.1 hypothetical protein [Gammaproteobacteria bacterium]MCP5415649.1 hypothetical protein [Chromatiaceae bacterium]